MKEPLDLQDLLGSDSPLWVQQTCQKLGPDVKRFRPQKAPNIGISEAVISAPI